MRWLLALFVLSTAACSRVRYVPLAEIERDPLDANAPVDVILTRPPRCPYRELGFLEAKTRNLEKALPHLRDKARSVGANMVWVKSEKGAQVEALALLIRCRAAAE